MNSPLAPPCTGLIISEDMPVAFDAGSVTLFVEGYFTDSGDNGPHRSAMRPPQLFTRETAATSCWPCNNVMNGCRWIFEVLGFLGVGVLRSTYYILLFQLMTRTPDALLNCIVILYVYIYIRIRYIYYMSYISSEC